VSAWLLFASFLLFRTDVPPGFNNRFTQDQFSVYKVTICSAKTDTVMKMVSIFLACYTLVFGAEIVGDKTIYTLGSLAAHYRVLPLFAGSSAAFMLKMLIAVLLGSTIAKFPVSVVTAVSAVTFFAMALVIWFKKPEDDEPITAHRRGKIALAAFASIFFSEWGDVGQVAAATLAAHYQLLVIVWMGAVLAMMTKAILVLTFGAAIRNRLPTDFLRYATAGTCVILGFLSAFRID
jgi:putative Ca2+/H+ antiporter (TMEM165/GDT1 family)